ncbi:hypothetical protein ANN_22036 [Periplaneta americana]|uniref:Uncharacterized protein n=1 Tax=Periplaneta americana TaxID=6978 RepID=A0ABQ8S7Z8_PERAM|nr:hypothetical protein ANN_22036 [Periplaneta americana]
MSQGSSTESYPAFARIGLRENPGKNLNQVTCPDRDSNPGHLVSQPDALTVTPQNTPILCMFMVCAMEVPCMPSVNMNDAFRTEGYHIEEYLLSMGLDERLGIAKERGNERSANRPYFGCGIKTATCNSPGRCVRFTPERNSALKQKEVPLKTRENIDPDF